MTDEELDATFMRARKQLPLTHPRHLQGGRDQVLAKHTEEAVTATPVKKPRAKKLVVTKPEKQQMAKPRAKPKKHTEEAVTAEEPQVTADSLKARLVAACDAKRIVLAELAKVLGVGSSLISQWKGGKKQIPAKHFAKINSFLSEDGF